MKNMTYKELNDAVRSGHVKVRSIKKVNNSSLSALHASIFRTSEKGTIDRCEACIGIHNLKVIEPKKREDYPGITTITEASKLFWGPAYVPVTFSHSPDGTLVNPEQIELMLIGFAPGGGTSEEKTPTASLLKTHAVPLGLSLADHGETGASRNRENIEYILGQINSGVGERDYFRIGHNIHFTNIFKCRSHGTNLSPFRREAQLCYDRYLQQEIDLLPNLKAIIMFIQKQNFLPLIRKSDAYGTIRKEDALPPFVYMWHFANPGFNSSRSKGNFERFCPIVGQEIMKAP